MPEHPRFRCVMMHYREAVREHPEASVEEQYAYGFANTLAKKEILIPEDDLFGRVFVFSMHIM